MMSCNLEEDEFSSAGTEGAITSQVFSGKVIDTAGAPVVGARVTINGITNITGSSGQYSTSIVDSPSGYQIDIRKDGFGPLTEFRLAGASALVHQMQAGFTRTLDPRVSNVVVDRNSGIQVTVPANSLRSNSGTPEGTVRFTIIPHTSQTMPGDFTATRADGMTVALVSVGAVTLQAVDSQNNTLGLVPGASLRVTLPVPASAGGTMPACVMNGACRTSMWQYNPVNARWIQQPAAAPAFSSNTTQFTVSSKPAVEVIPPSDGLGTWNADIEHYTPACIVIAFNNNIPPSCYNPLGATPEPGIKVTITQALAGSGVISLARPVLSSTAFLVLYNLRSNVDLDLSLTFPPGAPANCAANLMFTSNPSPSPGFPAGTATRLSTGAPWGGVGYPMDPTDPMHPPINLMDVLTGNHPCHSSVQIMTF